MSSKKLKRFRLSSTFYRNVKKRSSLTKTKTDTSFELASTSNPVSQVPNLDYAPTLPLPFTSSDICEETIAINGAPDIVTNQINLEDKCNMSEHSFTNEDDVDSESQILSNYEDNLSSNFDIADLKKDIQFTFRSQIQEWALRHQIRHNALNGLLGILKRMPNMEFLPDDSRSLLQTPRKNNIITMGNGKYWYNGLRNSITQVYSESRKLPTDLYLTFNIDGLPIAKSSKDQFWPILCKISDKEVSPLVVAIYYGSTKPPVNDFLQPFVDELLILLNEGILIGTHVINVKIRCFICDTPARCFVKGTMGFNSYHGCMKCIIIGEYDRKYRHMSFPRTDLPSRTDSSFRNRMDPDHHKEKTVIENLPIDMVEDFPVADALHLLDLGVMKRCLVGWTTGNFNFNTKWSAHDIQSISRKILEMKLFTPKEIHQGRMRDLDSLHFWKGTEFKNFLLYFGPVILKDYLSFEVYQHFLTLFCATRICSNNYYKSHWHVAQQLFEDYVEKFAEIYGHDSVGSNVHNLCHVVNDVSRFGHLPSLSAYPFESMLFKIKNLLRKGDLPLSQVANRLQELSKLNCYFRDSQTYPVVKHEKDLTTGETVFTTILLNEKCLLSSKEDKNKWFLSTDNNIVEIEYAIQIQGEIKVKGRSIKKKFNYFDKPFKSSHINVYATALSYETGESKTYTLQCIKCKLLSLIYHNNLIFIPILSTL